GLAACVVSCQKKTTEEAREHAAATAQAGADSMRLVKLQRGQQAFLANCAMCHGESGNGDGPLSGELQKQGATSPARLNDRARLDQLGHEEIARVIAQGGGHSGRSNLMPPWSEKLSPAQIDTIADFVMALPDLKPGTPASTIESYLS